MRGGRGVDVGLIQNTKAPKIFEHLIESKDNPVAAVLCSLKLQSLEQKLAVRDVYFGNGNKVVFRKWKQLDLAFSASLCFRRRENAFLSGVWTDEARKFSVNRRM